MQILEQREPLTANSNNEIFHDYENAEAGEKKSEPKEVKQSFSITPCLNNTPQFAGVSQILPSLYLCGASVISPTLVTQMGIDFVINVAPEMPDTPLPTTGTTLYLRIDVIDRPSADLAKHFDEVADMIEEIRLNGGKTLVHCVAGVSRSASLCLAYLIKYAGMNLKDAFTHVKTVRPQIRPNSGFFQQLRCYEEQRLGSLSVKMIFYECLQREIPDVYESEFRLMEEFYQKQRSANRRAHAKPLST